MYSRLSQHVHTNNILVAERYGFRKGISNEDAVFRKTDGVSISIKHTVLVGEILYDLTKASDFVNYGILLPKLHLY